MHRSENISELLVALTKAKQNIPAPVKTKQGYGYWYAPLDEILAKAEPSLLANGLAITHDRDLSQNELVTYLFHVSGQYISTRVKIEYKAENKMNLMQSLGSASTYAMRYNINALLNLAAEDDDDGVSSGDSKEKSVKTTESLPKGVSSGDSKEKSAKTTESLPKVEKITAAVRIPRETIDGVIRDIESFERMNPNLRSQIKEKTGNRKPNEWTYDDIELIKQILNAEVPF